MSHRIISRPLCTILIFLHDNCLKLSATDHNAIHTEKQLFTLIADGDTAAFRVLFDLYLPQVQPVIAGIIESEANVKDVAQEVFLILWIGRAKLATVESPRNWIFRIVYYQCYKHLRQQGVRTKAQQKLMDEMSGQPAPNPTEEYTAFEETSRLVKQAVTSLPPQAQKIYRLRREEDMPIADIADKLNISPKTVKNSLTRSLQDIREYLEKHGIVIPLFLIGYWLS